MSFLLHTEERHPASSHLPRPLLLVPQLLGSHPSVVHWEGQCLPEPIVPHPACVPQYYPLLPQAPTHLH